MSKSFIYKPNAGVDQAAVTSGCQDWCNIMATGIDAVVELGSNLVEWVLDYRVDPALEGYEYVALMIFHDALAKADAVGVMLRARTAETAKLQIRSIIEGMLSLEYLVRKKDDAVAKAYAVEGWIKDMKALLESTDGTQEQVNRDSFAHDDDMSKFIELDYDAEEIESYRQYLAAKLVHPKYALIVRELVESRGKKHWYSIEGGPRNARDLAREVRLLSYYDSMYRHFSSTMHASDTLKSMKLFGDRSVLTPIREIENAPYLAGLVVTMLTRMTRKVAVEIGCESMRVNVDYYYITRIRPLYKEFSRYKINYHVGEGDSGKSL